MALQCSCRCHCSPLRTRIPLFRERMGLQHHAEDHEAVEAVVATQYQTSALRLPMCLLCEPIAVNNFRFGFLGCNVTAAVVCVQCNPGSRKRPAKRAATTSTRACATWAKQLKLRDNIPPGNSNCKSWPTISACPVQGLRGHLLEAGFNNQQVPFGPRFVCAKPGLPPRQHVSPAQ